jgi:hypothetical protein
VTLRIDASTREFVVEYREQVVKRVPIKGLIGQRLPWDAYLEQISRQARHPLPSGSPISQQLRLPL